MKTECTLRLLITGATSNDFASWTKLIRFANRIQFNARFWEEDKLIRLASSLEQKMPWRDRIPLFMHAVVVKHLRGVKAKKKKKKKEDRACASTLFFICE